MLSMIDAEKIQTKPYQTHSSTKNIQIIGQNNSIYLCKTVGTICNLQIYLLGPEIYLEKKDITFLCKGVFGSFKLYISGDF